MTSTAIYKEEDLKDIKDLLGIFVEYETVPRGSTKIRSIQDQVNILFARDYEFSKIDNSDGNYCKSYPLDLIILTRQKHSSSFSSSNPEGEPAIATT